MREKIKKILRKKENSLLANPWLFYKKDQYLLNKPFYFEGRNHKAVILIHGWTSVPYEVRRLGKFLNKKGYTVSAPLLHGHGTVPKDLEKTRWTDWLQDITKTYNKLKKTHSKIYVVGTSIGANLAVILAKNKSDISGLVLMAMPYKIRLEKAVLFFAKFLALFKKYNKKFYPPTFGVATSITRLISYQTYPIKSAFEAFVLIKISRKELPKITQPCFMMQSSSDHIVTKKSLEKIYAAIGSKIKKKKYIKKAYHTFITDIKNENVFQEILEFLQHN